MENISVYKYKKDKEKLSQVMVKPSKNLLCLVLDGYKMKLPSVPAKFPS